MAFAKGRDDESEALGKKLEERKDARDMFMTFFGLGNQYAQQADAGTAEAEVVLRAAAVEAGKGQEGGEQKGKVLQPPRSKPAV